MDPYNTSDMKPLIDTVRIHEQFKGHLFPVRADIKQWGISNLPDGDYVCRYEVRTDWFQFLDVGTPSEVIGKAIDVPYMRAHG
jgi:hypothetical protein